LTIAPFAEFPVPEANDIQQRLLVVRCQLGERAALDELVQTWERPLLYYLWRLLPADQDALQVMQEVWIRVLSSIGGLREPDQLAPWLYVLTRRTFIDHVRDLWGLPR
jgi:RNA polymerase sigma-70 factor (ECF subfamily)